MGIYRKWIDIKIKSLNFSKQTDNYLSISLNLYVF
ncbi:hypothetical protein FVB9532_00903 [Mesonia oceanica]|uniref:Uncharacterized protein n=1 Tax=Mesonia oceanica TaxID=2687242 RepID=A0AC61Y6W5_9FLAO|nr:hypothetical protein FVB9532_00903 [Mesonia oceanica]